MSRDALERPLLRFLQLHGGSLLLGLSLSLHKRDDGVRADGPRGWRTRDTQRCDDDEVEEDRYEVSRMRETSVTRS